MPPPSTSPSPRRTWPPGQARSRIAEAATLPLAALTAWQALVDHAAVEAGERVLVHGAGGVGVRAVFFVVTPDAGELAHLARLVDDRRLRPVVSQTFKLSEGRHADSVWPAGRPGHPRGARAGSLAGSAGDAEDDNVLDVGDRPGSRGRGCGCGGGRTRDKGLPRGH
ncbi:MAG TPA: hypothetical protein VHZ03_47980 [Trebonia sp.]|nr:hypothetical protein [Trebonia sp.]